MKNRTLQVLFLALLGMAATANCGKGSDTGPAPRGPTDVVVTWTFDGKPASAEECTARGGVTVSVTMSATSDPKLHQHDTADCAKGTLTFAGLDTGSLGTPFLEGTLLDDKGLAKTTANVTVTPAAGKTAVTLDFFPSEVMTTGETTADATTDAATTADASSASSGGMGGMGGMSATSSASASSSSSSSAASSSASASSTATGAGGAKP